MINKEFYSQGTETIDAPEIGVIDGVTVPAKVILYNDEIHSFDEVIAQLIKAINCSAETGEHIAWEVHTRGKAIVFDGEMHECLRISSILEEIALHTNVEY